MLPRKDIYFNYLKELGRTIIKKEKLSSIFEAYGIGVGPRSAGYLPYSRSFFGMT
jgi:hypothetical protein